METVGTNEVMAAAQSVLTYVIVMAMRSLAPDFWDGLNSRFKRMLSVAAAATLVSVVSGIMAGQQWKQIGASAIVALAGAVALRQATKKGRPIESTYDAVDGAPSRGYRSKAPDIISERREK